MPRFLAMTSRGLRDALEKEMNQLQLQKLDVCPEGVYFEGSWKDCYRANLCLRTATRILYTIQDFNAHSMDEFQIHINKHDFTKYITCDQTLAVDAHVRESQFKDQRFVALKVKDTVVDQFTEKFGKRPDVDKDHPHLKIVLRVFKSQVSVAIDTSGETLSKRGYRQESGRAPLREHMAAALLDMTGWEPSIPLVDPMCGAGTFLIEAALIGGNIAPGSLRKGFAFQKILGFQEDVWSEVLEESFGKEIEEPQLRLYGSDISKRAVEGAENNSERAGVEEWVSFASNQVAFAAPDPELEGQKGIIIVNPPYGERISVTEELKDVYRDLAYAMKKNFKGWTCWLLSGNEELTRSLGLKATGRIPVMNGSIECRFLKYEIR